VEVRIQALELDGQTIFSAFLHDITERKRSDAAKEREARQDILTGLPNRRALFEMLQQAIARSSRNGTAIALLFLDLDGFKAVNDAMGHEAGDSLLREIARRLSDGIHQTDFVARLGGDEFTVILEKLSRRDDAIGIAEKLLANIRKPVQIGIKSVQVSASIGIAFHEHSTEISPDHFVKSADSAMYEAKRSGKSTICVRGTHAQSTGLLAIEPATRQQATVLAHHFTPSRIGDTGSGKA
jgi:diguanylate cyclase (GGDEF)-like protein